MNVLVLNGSPRAKGNTSALVEVFRKEAERLGHTVHVVQIGKMEIRGCKNCNACRRTLNGECVQKDDLQSVLPYMRTCEVLILATPIYYYSMAGQLHCAIERMYSFERLPKLRKAALIMTAAGGGFDSAYATYRDAFLGHMGAQNLGVITSIGAESHSEAKQEEVRQLARRI